MGKDVAFMNLPKFLDDDAKTFLLKRAKYDSKITE